MLNAGLGAILLESNVKFRSELRFGDEAEVSCAFLGGDGKVFRIGQQIVKSDGTLAGIGPMARGMVHKLR